MGALPGGVGGPSSSRRQRRAVACGLGRLVTGREQPSQAIAANCRKPVRCHQSVDTAVVGAPQACDAARAARGSTPHARAPRAETKESSHVRRPRASTSPAVGADRLCPGPRRRVRRPADGLRRRRDAVHARRGPAVRDRLPGRLGAHLHRRGPHPGRGPPRALRHDRDAAAGQLRVQGRRRPLVGHGVRLRGLRRRGSAEHPAGPGREHTPARRPGPGDRPHDPDACGPAGRGRARRGARRARAPARRRSAVLLRHDGPVRQRRPDQRPRRPDRRPAHHGLRPHGQGLLPGRRHRGPARPARLRRGPRHDRDLADTVLHEQVRPGRRDRRRLGRLPRLLGHGLHLDRPALRLEGRARRAHRRRARPRDRRLLRHHREPHGGRDPVRAAAGGRFRPLPVRVAGRRAVHRRRRRAVRAVRRRGPHVPRARPRHVVPVHPGRRPGRGGRQGARVAQRPDAVPQPRQLDLRGGVLDAR